MALNRGKWILKPISFDKQNTSPTTTTVKLIYFLGFSALTFISVVTGFPEHGSLAGLPVEERDLKISRLQAERCSGTQISEDPGFHCHQSRILLRLAPLFYCIR